jgi:SPP1 gp7 family putative phage head morphogenesis protein
MRWSKRLRKDPTMTARIVKVYERELTDVIAKNRDHLRLAVDVSRQLAIAQSIDLSNAKAKVSVILDQIMLPAFIRKSDEVMPVAQSMARVRTDQLLKQQGITPMEGGFQDRTLNDIIRERNIGALKGLTDSMGKDISRELVDGISKGEGVDKLVKRIDDVADVGVERARVIARTETLYAFNTAAKERYERNGITDVQWLAALNEQTCETCIDLDGRTFPIGEVPDCPKHPSCRCTLIPLVPSGGGQ